jgi:hypothetical protein
MCDRMNSLQVVLCLRSGDGAIPCRLRSCPRSDPGSRDPNWRALRRFDRSPNRSSHAAVSRLVLQQPDPPAGDLPVLDSSIVELLSNELSVPGKNRVRLGNTGDFLKSFPPQTFGDLGQGRPLSIRQLQSPFDLRFENPVLGSALQRDPTSKCGVGSPTTA